MMLVTIEFTGAARALTNLKEMSLAFEGGETYRDLVYKLAQQFPALVGVLIAPDRCSFLSANFFSRNGEEPILPDMMDASPRDGDRLVILYFIVGGKS